MDEAKNIAAFVSYYATDVDVIYCLGGPVGSDA